MRNTEKRGRVFDRLHSLNINYSITEHPAAYTIDEMAEMGITSEGEVCKNLFLRDDKGRRHFLVVTAGRKKTNLKELQTKLGCSRLSFASEKRLEKYLGLKQGEVSPLGIINDTDKSVEVIIDSELEGNMRLGIHPNDNTATVWMTYDDLIKVISENGNKMIMVDI